MSQDMLTERDVQVLHVMMNGGSLTVPADFLTTMANVIAGPAVAVPLGLLKKVAPTYNALLEAARRDEGMRRFFAGDQIGVSTGIDESTTYGYGQLSPNGFWEFPVPEELVGLRRSMMDECALAKRDLEAMEEKYKFLRFAIMVHHGQKADDRCVEDDDKLYAAAGLGPVDRRVGDQTEMLKNCQRFIQRRTEGGGWPSYQQLEGLLEEVLKKIEDGWRVHLGGERHASQVRVTDDEMAAWRRRFRPEAPKPPAETPVG